MTNYEFEILRLMNDAEFKGRAPETSMPVGISSMPGEAVATMGSSATIEDFKAIMKLMPELFQGDAVQSFFLNEIFGTTSAEILRAMTVYQAFNKDVSQEKIRERVRAFTESLFDMYQHPTKKAENFVDHMNAISEAGNTPEEMLQVVEDFFFTINPIMSPYPIYINNMQPKSVLGREGTIVSHDGGPASHVYTAQKSFEDGTRTTILGGYLNKEHLETQIIHNSLESCPTNTGLFFSKDERQIFTTDEIPLVGTIDLMNGTFRNTGQPLTTREWEAQIVEVADATEKAAAVAGLIFEPRSLDRQF